jgi:CDP-diacylglycerol--serine O-phosphatidyltransferase
MSERPKALFRTFVLADFITLGNAAAGTASLFCCLLYLDERQDIYLTAAFWLLPLALILDVADGTVARKTGRQSPFGGDLDSLADTVSFGVAPAVLAFTLGMRGIWDALVLVAFVSCGISRLARFNVTAKDLTGKGGKVKYYEGTPIPTSLVLVLLLAIAWSQGAVHEALWGGSFKLGPGTFHPWVLLYALSGSLMVSTRLRIPKP